MTSSAVSLFTWSLLPSEEAATPTAQKNREAGWKGIGLNCPSPYEARAISDFLIDAFANGTYPEYSFCNFVVYDDSLDGYGNADIPEAELWLPQDADEQPLYDFLATIPPRAVEFVTTMLTDEMEEFLRGVNHLVIEYESDADVDLDIESDFTPCYLISMEGDVEMVARLKEMAPWPPE